MKYFFLGVKAKKPLKKVSNKQAAIKRRLAIVYAEIDSERDPVCQGCGRNYRPLSHSHTISQKRCKEIGKPELIYDKRNIEIECFGDEDCCHEIWESRSVAGQLSLISIVSKLEFIRKHDIETYNKMMSRFEAFEQSRNEGRVK